KGRVLKLWIESAKRDPNKPQPKGAAAPQPLPQRLQAVGEVTAHSADFDIEFAEILNVMFRDGEPLPEPKQPVPAAKPDPVAAAGPGVGPMSKGEVAAAPPPPKEEPKKEDP